jgi:hypothetical protein
MNKFNLKKNRVSLVLRVKKEETINSIRLGYDKIQNLTTQQQDLLNSMRASYTWLVLRTNWNSQVLSINI